MFLSLKARMLFCLTPKRSKSDQEKLDFASIFSLDDF